MRIVFKAPSPEEPGYLLRVKKSLIFRQQLSSEEPNPETIDALVDFLVSYVTEPENRNEAKDALFMASQDQFNELLKAVVSENDTGNPT